jgi:protein phosphatase
MTVFNFTDKGNREVNQDYATSKTLNDNSAVFILADGMGGYSYGEVAAKVVADAIAEYADQHLKDASPIKVLKQAVAYANDELYVKRLTLGCQEMGCVVVCLLLINDKAYITWLGDSRIYIFRNGIEIFRSEDHSLINELKRSRTLKRRNLEELEAIVTKAVMGTDELDSVDVYELETEKGDVFYLCSDGIHKELMIERLLNMDDTELKSYLEDFSSNFNDNATLMRVIV